MIFVPIISWTEHDKGSLGGLSSIGVDGFDRVSPIAQRPRILTGDLSAHLSVVFTYQLISADPYQHPADYPTLSPTDKAI